MLLLLFVIPICLNSFTAVVFLWFPVCFTREAFRLSPHIPLFCQCRSVSFYYTEDLLRTLLENLIDLHSSVDVSQGAHYIVVFPSFPSVLICPRVTETARSCSYEELQCWRFFCCYDNSVNVGDCSVCYRDSKISQLLRDSLGNVTCRTCMLAHVSSAVPHYNETLQVIQLAARIHRMKRRRTKVSDGDDKGS